VNDPDAIFTFPGEAPIACGDLEDNGEQALIDDDFCSTLPALTAIACDCQPVNIPVTETPVFVVPSAAPIQATEEPTQDVEVCSVCGEGKEVNNPDAIFAFPGEAPIKCGELEDKGEQGLLDDEFCSILPAVASIVCDCQPVEGCSICGEGKEVNDPDAIFAFPGQAPITCGELEDNGGQGLIDNDFCSILPGITEIVCDCQAVNIRFFSSDTDSSGKSFVESQPPRKELVQIEEAGEEEETNNPIIGAVIILTVTGLIAFAAFLWVNLF